MPRKTFTTDDVAEGQCRVLQERYGRLRSPAKEMARDTGDSERACRNRLAGTNCFSLTDFFNAARNVPELRAWGAMMLGLEGELDPDFQRELTQGVRTITLKIEGDGVRVVTDAGGPLIGGHK